MKTNFPCCVKEIVRIEVMADSMRGGKVDLVKVIQKELRKRKAGN